MRKDRPQTPDGRYFVARGQLRRCTNPLLADAERRALIKSLMQARMSVRNAVSEADHQYARVGIETAKEALGEAGPAWWGHGVADVSGLHPSRTEYAEWWNSLSTCEQQKAE